MHSKFDKEFNALSIATCQRSQLVVFLREGGWVSEFLSLAS